MSVSSIKCATMASYATFLAKSFWFSIRPSRHDFKFLVKLSMTVGARSRISSGSAFKASSLDESIPLCLEQAPFMSHPSGSPQSQHPPTLVFNQVLWPSWSELLKQSRQMMQVGSFSQSSHFHATSPALSGLAHTPSVRLSSHIYLMT